MLLLLGLLLLYLAAFAFYQAGKKRTMFESVKGDVSKQRLVRLGGWGLAVVSLALLSLPQGLERGVPLWLAAFMLAAFSCLLIGSLFPKRHLVSAQIAAGLAVGVVAMNFVWSVL